MTATQLENMEVEVAPILAIQLSVTCRSDAIGETVGAAFKDLAASMGQLGITPAGPPRVLYTGWGPDETTFRVMFPIAAQPEGTPADTRITIEPVNGGRALRFVHHGPYTDLRETYARIDAWLRDRGGISTEADWARYSPMWEEYLNEPGTVPDSDLLTRIYLTLHPV